MSFSCPARARSPPDGSSSTSRPAVPSWWRRGRRWASRSSGYGSRARCSSAPTISRLRAALSAEAHPERADRHLRRGGQCRGRGRGARGRLEHRLIRPHALRLPGAPTDHTEVSVDQWLAFMFDAKLGRRRRLRNGRPCIANRACRSRRVTKSLLDAKLDGWPPPLSPHTVSSAPSSIAAFTARVQRSGRRAGAGKSSRPCSSGIAELATGCSPRSEPRVSSIRSRSSWNP